MPSQIFLQILRSRFDNVLDVTAESVAEPAQARARFRAGLRMPTASWAAGFTQANLVVLPQDVAGEFELFARRNPKPCPVLDIGEPGRADPVGARSGPAHRFARLPGLGER